MRVWCPNVVERNSCLSLFAFPTISSSSISFLVLRLYSYQPLFFLPDYWPFILSPQVLLFLL